MMIDFFSDVLIDLWVDVVVIGCFMLSVLWVICKLVVVGVLFCICVGSLFFLVVVGVVFVYVELGDFVLLLYGDEYVMVLLFDVLFVLFDMLMVDKGIWLCFDMLFEFVVGGGGVISEFYMGIVVYCDIVCSLLFLVLLMLIYVCVNDVVVVLWFVSML